MRITKSNFLDTLAFTIAILWFVYIRVVGNLYLSELLLILVFILMFKSHGRKLSEPLPKQILLFGFLWLLSQVATDLIRLTPVESLMKGWASIIFFLIAFASMYMLFSDNVRRLKIFIIGYALAGILRCYISPPSYGFDVEPWKFGFGLPVTILTIFLIIWAIQKKIIIPVMGELSLLLLGGASIYMNARSLGGVIVMTALFLFMSRTGIFQNFFRRRLSIPKLIIFSTFGVLMILLSYQWAGESDILPESAQFKFELNKSSSFGVFGIILAGRNELLGSIPAVIDSPIIGHGSWAEDPKYRQYLYMVVSSLGVERDEEQLRRGIESRDSIPAHSHLMQSWVWAGLLGAVFWMFILKLIAKAAIDSIKFHNPLNMLILFVCIKAVWDLLFSPFSSEMRLLWAWELVLIVMAIANIDKTVERIK